MLADRAKAWCEGGRRNVSIDMSSQTGTPKITVWAYDFDAMHGCLIDVDDPHWPTIEELKEKRVADLKRQIEEVAA